MPRNYNIYVEDINRRKSNDCSRDGQDGGQCHKEEIRDSSFQEDGQEKRRVTPEEVGITKLIFIGGEIARCDDCLKPIQSGEIEDELSYFSFDRCKDCTDKMFSYMESYA